MNAEEYVNTFVTTSVHQQQQRSSHWKRPCLNWTKCNNEVSFRNVEIEPQAWWVSKDDRGTYRGAGQAIGLKVSNVLEGKCQRLIQAMQHFWS